jgi:hypothetical protein
MEMDRVKEKGEREREREEKQREEKQRERETERERENERNEKFKVKMLIFLIFSQDKHVRSILSHFTHSFSYLNQVFHVNSPCSSKLSEPASWGVSVFVRNHIIEAKRESVSVFLLILSLPQSLFK